MDCADIDTDGLIELTNQNTFSIYPNPSFNNATIKFNNANEDNYQLLITNLSGQQLYSEKVSGTNLSTGYKLDLQNFEQGVYFVSIQNGSEVRVVKLVKGN
ncbi:MAG: T9SS type A sorting domain-containing protein [Crocinitomix sp.]|nr:T9SS type A sorting domain-containing protein [Crocinitomix sp.]